LGCFGGTGGRCIGGACGESLHRRAAVPLPLAREAKARSAGGGGDLGREKFLDRAGEDCYNRKLQGTLGADPLQLHCSQGDSSAVTIGK
jgi:hypothetical protein